MREAYCSTPTVKEVCTYNMYLTEMIYFISQVMHLTKLRINKLPAFDKESTIFYIIFALHFSRHKF
jgi:hypothetical protein